MKVTEEEIRQCQRNKQEAWPCSSVSSVSDSRARGPGLFPEDLCLPRNSVLRLTDHPEMTIPIYLGHKARRRLFVVLLC